MNIVAILGSPHGMRGNTGRLLAAALRSAEEAWPFEHEYWKSHGRL